ncbi:MAG: hypothetical protein ACRDGI_10485 [Candidatus Limnocylindrales bacterium]
MATDKGRAQTQKARETYVRRIVERSRQETFSRLAYHKALGATAQQTADALGVSVPEVEALDRAFMEEFERRYPERIVK